MNESLLPGLVALIPIIIMSIFCGIPIYIIAKPKGYTSLVAKFFIWCPLINLFSIWVFVGLPDKELHKKIDILLEQTKK
ncbi:MAG: hypothetical protein LBQ51_01810 [Desulfovibrio sp.]|nr:hypothetical protein [Desulfovibrio sp.]